MKVQVPITVTDGKIELDRELLKKQLSGCTFKGHLTIEDRPLPKSLQQLGAFWAAVVPQVQKHQMNREGFFMSGDRIKEKLKQRFLAPVKRYYSDGSPVMVKVPHPERKNTYWEWHLEEIPSMSELSMDQMTSFMSEIIHHYWHEEGLQIIIK